MTMRCQLLCASKSHPHTMSQNSLPTLSYMAHRPMTRDELAAAINSGLIDTVIMAFPDMQGRMVGKRMTGWFFLQDVADHGTENCNYLIATDMDDTALPGFAFASYDQGYGDMVAMPDWDTIRVLPWQKNTVLILCDLSDPRTSSRVAVSPRQILRDQVSVVQQAGFVPMIGSEIEFYLFHESYREAFEKEYRGLSPHSPWMQDYQIVQTTFDEYVIGDIRRNLDECGIPV